MPKMTRAKIEALIATFQPGDRIVARGVWHPTFKDREATVGRVTATAVYINFDGLSEGKGYSKTGWLPDQYFERVKS